jgi:hypothetical protein
VKIRFKRGLPPNIIEIAAHFPLSGDEIFTYGDTIYTPAQLSRSLVAHEKVHIKQQLGMGPEAWWDRYLEDPQFRLEQELEAHRAEYKAGGKLSEIAERLASPLYGGLVSEDEAREMICSKQKRKN